MPNIRLVKHPATGAEYTLDLANVSRLKLAPYEGFALRKNEYSSLVAWFKANYSSKKDVVKFTVNVECKNNDLKDYTSFIEVSGDDCTNIVTDFVFGNLHYEKSPEIAKVKSRLLLDFAYSALSKGYLLAAVTYRGCGFVFVDNQVVQIFDRLYCGTIDEDYLQLLGCIGPLNLSKLTKSARMVFYTPEAVMKMALDLDRAIKDLCDDHTYTTRIDFSSWYSAYDDSSDCEFVEKLSDMGIMLAKCDEPNFVRNNLSSLMKLMTASDSNFAVDLVGNRIYNAIKHVKRKEV